jgi:1-acyl-sn-glycerol-3-phosphate acyltransferase
MEEEERQERRDISAATDELRAAAAAKRAELRESALARADELRHTAAAKGGDLRAAAVSRGGELGRAAATRSADLRRQMRELDVPWARCAPARMARETILQFVLGPLVRLYTSLRIHGRERFDELPPPVILAANHSSHLDTPTILRALPLQWRQRTAVAAAADYFYKKRLVAHAVALIFNTVPILRRGEGTGEGSFDHVDRLLAQRWNLLIYPEGTRSREGELGKLRSGAAVIALRHGIPIVPIRVEGTHDAMPPGQNWPKRRRGFFSRRHRVEVHFGQPIWPAEGDDRHDLMRRVRSHLDPAAASAPEPPQKPVQEPAEDPEGSHEPVPARRFSVQRRSQI